MGRHLRCPIPSLFFDPDVQQLTHLGGHLMHLDGHICYFKTLCTPTPPFKGAGNMFRYQSFSYTPKIF